jgi:hypothetical protein
MWFLFYLPPLLLVENLQHTCQHMRLALWPKLCNHSTVISGYTGLIYTRLSKMPDTQFWSHWRSKASACPTSSWIYHSELLMGVASCEPIAPTQRYYHKHLSSPCLNAWGKRVIDRGGWCPEACSGFQRSQVALGMSQTMELRFNPTSTSNRSTRKSKAGCKACKLRKVKVCAASVLWNVRRGMPAWRLQGRQATSGGLYGRAEM